VPLEHAPETLNIVDRVAAAGHCAFEVRSQSICRGGVIIGLGHPDPLINRLDFPANPISSFDRPLEVALLSF
jgi:hypothetical protein